MKLLVSIGWFGVWVVACGCMVDVAGITFLLQLYFASRFARLLRLYKKGVKQVSLKEVLL